MSTLTCAGAREPGSPEARTVDTWTPGVVCEATSPGGTLVCANPTCNGRSHVWIHLSSAHDAKIDADSAVDAHD